MEQTNYSERGVRRVLEQLGERRFDRIFFVACGGSSALMYPSAYLVDTRSRTLAAEYLNSNEFIYRAPARLDERAVVILWSQEGKTPETVEAARFARAKGAAVLTIAMREGTPLEAAGEGFVLYGHYETCPMKDTSYGVMYMLTAGLIDRQEGAGLLEGMVRALEALDPVVQRAKQDWQPRAMEFAQSCRDARVLYSLASGCDYSQAYVLCNCYMMEMQWINAIPIHAGEFFHGPFEIIEEDSPVILLLGRDETRFLEERALAFCKKFTQKLFVIDAAEIDFGAVEPAYEGFMAVLVLNNICRLYSKAIAGVRGHSLDLRRYMHLMDY